MLVANRPRNVPTYRYCATVKRFISSATFSKLCVSFVCCSANIEDHTYKHEHCDELLITERRNDYCKPANFMKPSYNIARKMKWSSLLSGNIGPCLLVVSSGRLPLISVWRERYSISKN